MDQSLKSTYPFTPKRREINGHRMSYVDEGEGEVIIMLHGNPSWSFLYRNLITLLAQKYRVIAPDHIGCGLSDKPQDYPYHLKNHIANIEGLLDQLQIDRYSLVVHDWGGAIGLGVVGRNPDRVESLVVMNSAAFRSQKIPWRIRICRTPILGDILIRGLNGFAKGALFMAVASKMAPEVAEGFIKPYDSWANRIATLRFVQDIPLSPQDYSWPTIVEVENNLEKLRDKPMLLVWGGADFCFTKEFYDEWLHRFPEAQSHFFANAGHYLLEDAFPEIGPLITNFFAENIEETS